MRQSGGNIRTTENKRDQLKMTSMIAFAAAPCGATRWRRRVTVSAARGVAQCGARPRRVIRTGSTRLIMDAEATAALGTSRADFEKYMAEQAPAKWASEDIKPRRVTQTDFTRRTKIEMQKLVGEDVTDVKVLRNAFAVVLLSSSALAVLAAAVLPPQAAYYSSYLIGGVSLVVLGVGSTNPGILSAILAGARAQSASDKQERVARHEAAHLLVAYLVGLPIAEFNLQASGSNMDAVQLFELDGTRAELDKASVVGLAGGIGEAMAFGEAFGIRADLDLLQSLLIRANPPLRGKEIQEQTLWAAYTAYVLLEKHRAAWDALCSANLNNANGAIRLADAIEIIEKASL
ncbi:hypothetical protein FVE85_4737 [Porphyridium purpureum]|uniref:Uncharacterized protein n=1 Tax=Porphyridium purpureum TaxID=35688 RepID=A0A5J4YRT2_PORPP|nr:hypothetical protein FVE85_4737 [Porphyridium purpureum]|eukprot:POR8774..scf236_6